jgi:hypothetical protein
MGGCSKELPTVKWSASPPRPPVRWHLELEFAHLQICEQYISVVLWSDYGLLGVLPKASCAGSLIPNVAVLRGCRTFKRWGLAGDCGLAWARP